MSIPIPAWQTSVVAKNYGTRGPGVLPKFVVLHDTANVGTHAETLYLASKNDRGVSVDFTVERDGSIWKLNPDLEMFYTFHAGRSTRFGAFKNSQVNRNSIGIEICQTAKVKPYPAVQVEAVARLCAWLVDHFKLDAEAAITTHAKIITDGSRSDPRAFPFDGAGGFWARFRLFVADSIAPSRPAPVKPSAPLLNASQPAIVFRGKMSTFGGPADTGVSASEGLALRAGGDVTDPRLGAVFLTRQPARTTGLARRLNPDAFYLACRWDYVVTSKAFLRAVTVAVTNPRTGKVLEAIPVDWGPNARTGRIADLSPGLARALDLKTDDECLVTIPVPGAPAPSR